MNMQKLIKHFLAVVCAALCALETSGALSVSKGSNYSRSSGAKSMSGITWAGGNTYYLIADNNSNGEVGLYKATITTAANGLSVSSFSVGPRVELTMVTDLEAVAYDPASGNVWAADEAQKTIAEYDPTTGAVLRWLDVPAILKKNVGNFGFESLTISGDGLALWTANEEALTCDGPRSSYTQTTTVRLVKFTRTTVHDDWQLAAMYPYTTDKWTQPYSYGTAGRRGVSDLCALPDGSLIVLERELSSSVDGTDFWAGLGVKLYHTLYHVTAAALASAQDVKDCEALTNISFTAVSKTSLYNSNPSSDGTSWSNTEGICLGLRLSSGANQLLVVTDAGDGTTNEQIIPYTLSGISVRTLSFSAPSNVVSSIEGSYYRFVDGTNVLVALSGITESKAYTNNGEVCTMAEWTLPNHTPSSGAGPSASFMVAADDTFTWNVSNITAVTEIGSHDSFEGFAVGTFAHAITSWSGNGVVEALTYVPSIPPGYPLPRENHTKVLNVEDPSVRTLPDNISGNRHIDFMVEVRRSQIPITDVAASTRVGVHIDNDGCFRLWHLKNVAGAWTTDWTRVSEKVYADGDWVRVGLDLEDYGGIGFCRIKLDGSLCPTAVGFRSPSDPTPYGAWHRIASGTASEMSEIEFSGTRVDDLLITTDAFIAEHTGPTSTNGIDFAWFDAAGLPRDPNAAAPNLPGKTAQYLHDSGVDPYSDKPLSITHMELGTDGKVRMEFNAYKGDNPAAYYRVLSSTNLNEWTPRGSSAGVFNGNFSTWSSTWEGDAENPALLKEFFKIEAEPTGD